MTAIRINQKKYLLSALFAFCFVAQCVAQKPKSGEIKGKAARSFFEGEIRPGEVIPCFKGAFYRKVVSSKDKWVGISGTVILPQIEFDSGQKRPEKPGQFMDNPSVYLGGNMNGQETDIGLTWEVIREADGGVSAERKAFRPFFRRTGLKSTGQEAKWITAPAQTAYYWYPGEEIVISLIISDDGKLKFTIDGAGKYFESEYEADGYTKDGIGEFKRVNAIDQVRNEGKAARPTRTTVRNAVWKETFLYRNHKGKVVRVPMHEGRYTDMRCPDERNILIEAGRKDKKRGAETITIRGH